MSKIAAIFETPEMSQAQYDSFIKEMEENGTLKQKAREFHVAAPGDNGWFVLDVWESEDELKEFGNVLIPLFTKHGLTPPKPKIMQVHNIM